MWLVSVWLVPYCSVVSSKMFAGGSSCPSLNLSEYPSDWDDESQDVGSGGKQIMKKPVMKKPVAAGQISDDESEDYVDDEGEEEELDGSGIMKKPVAADDEDEEEEADESAIMKKPVAAGDEDEDDELDGPAIMKKPIAAEDEDEDEESDEPAIMKKPVAASLKKTTGRNRNKTRKFEAARVANKLPPAVKAKYDEVCEKKGHGTTNRDQITEVINSCIVWKKGKPVVTDEHPLFKQQKYEGKESYDKKCCAGSRFFFPLATYFQ